MSDPLKAGIKTSEGLASVVTIIVGLILSVLQSLNVIEVSDVAGLQELVVNGVVALITFVTTCVVVINLLKNRSAVKIEAVKSSVKTTG